MCQLSQAECVWGRQVSASVCVVCVQGTAGQEVEAVGDLSALVNYIEPIRFHSFEHADSTRRIRSFIYCKNTEQTCVHN